MDTTVALGPCPRVVPDGRPEADPAAERGASLVFFPVALLQPILSARPKLLAPDLEGSFLAASKGSMPSFMASSSIVASSAKDPAVPGGPERGESRSW